MVRQVKVISEFDVCLGRVVKSKRVKAAYTRQALADAAGIPEANLKRREDGKNEITVSELERIASIVRVSAAAMVEEALADYGGLSKLIGEHARVSEAAPTFEDNITYLGHVDVLANAADDNARAPEKD